ncbi:MAG: ABC transporter permease subunit [Planctomycetota bacterium]|jgi:iron(III) transport system permease protein|nr:ABC transporter permease subunit [Planctomycetota bacterium]
MRPRPGGKATLVLLLPLAALLLGVLYPAAILLGRSMTDNMGSAIGLANFSAYFRTPGLATSLYHTLGVGVIVAAAVAVLAYALAYAFTHALVVGDRACRYLVVLPLSVPSVFFPIGMIYIFGRHGILSGVLGVGNIYGWSGIVFGEIVFIMPHATLLLVTALCGVDRRLYLAAQTLGASPWRRFRTITLPQTRNALLRAFLVAFILAITDFGVPKVLGGDYSMLSTELYTQIIGLQDLGMGSAIGVIMLVPSLMAFALDLWLVSSHPGQAQTGRYEKPVSAGARDLTFSLFAWGIVTVPTAIILAAVGGSFVAFWPYDLAPTLANYRFENSVYNIQPFFNSLEMSAAAAVAGMAITFAGAYVAVRTGANRLLSLLYRGMAFLSVGIPGTVLGLAFVFAFNRPENVLQLFYGSRAFLVFYCLIHFYAMGHLISAAGLASLDFRYEDAGKTLGVGRLSTFFRVILPLRFPVALEVAFYFFINAMTTVSGMVFIFSPDNAPASVAMLHFTDTGNYGEAAAMGALILAATLVARVAQEVLARRLRRPANRVNLRYRQ